MVAYHPLQLRSSQRVGVCAKRHPLPTRLLSFFFRTLAHYPVHSNALVFFCVYIPGNQSGGSALCICSKPSLPHPQHLPHPNTHTHRSLQSNCSLPINNLKFMHFATTHTHACHLRTHSASRVATKRKALCLKRLLQRQSWVNATYPELSKDLS